MPDRTPLILDVDTGIDDSLALLYAAASPDAELVAVTCVAGNVDAQQVAANTLAVLELAGRGDVEVALGREVPLVRPLETTPETHGPRGLGYAELPPAAAALSERHAVDLLIDEARRRPGELTLVTLGPLTNLAVAVLREPELPRLYRRYVLMGGAYRSPGNTAPDDRVEHQRRSGRGEGRVQRLDGRPRGRSLDRPAGRARPRRDRASAKIVPDHVVALARRAGSTPRRLAARWPAARTRCRRPAPWPRTRSSATSPTRCGSTWSSTRATTASTGRYIHDPLAVAAALDPTLIRTEALPVDVELGGTLTTGETVTDWRRVWGRPPNIDVAVEADAETFLERFVERVGRLAAELAARGTLCARG